MFVTYQKSAKRLKNLNHEILKKGTKWRNDETQSAFYTFHKKY